MGFLAGTRIRECSFDTLKKTYATHQKGTPHGFWQVLPLRTLAGPEHLRWVAFSVLTDFESKSLHFRQPELELLGRVAGTFQWAETQARAGLKDSDDEVVLVWIGPSKTMTPALFSRIAKEWGLKPSKWIPQKDAAHSVSLIERSALAGIER